MQGGWVSVMSEGILPLDMQLSGDSVYLGISPLIDTHDTIIFNPTNTIIHHLETSGKVLDDPGKALISTMHPIGLVKSDTPQSTPPPPLRDGAGHSDTRPKDPEYTRESDRYADFFSKRHEGGSQNTLKCFGSWSC